jgi:hypothetical protein
LANVYFVAGFTRQSVKSTFVTVRDCFMAFRSGLLLYLVRGFKGYFDVSVLEKIGDLSKGLW